jgi:L-lactate dehydrogenase complex protein LldF
MSIRIGQTATAPPFQQAARQSLQDTQLRRNVRHATDLIRNKRAAIVAEVPDWEELREAGRAIKSHVMRHLDAYLEQFESNVTRAGGHVHWAGDADEACEVIASIIGRHDGREVIKVKTMTSDEIQLNTHLQARGITPYETDLADLIIQLGRDHPSHIVVPALHKNHMQVRQIFERTMPLAEWGLDKLGDTPKELAEAARRYLRERFLRVKIGLSGANFAIAETGSVVVVESEGNGRMCTTLPDVLVTLVGIEKIVPTFQDLEVFLQVLARSATGERMSPYTSVWTGVDAQDGPGEFHVVLLDNGRTRVLADGEGRQALHCIRCAACLNACPVYARAGGHAYGSIYSGPIGAILTPQLQALEHAQSLPYASSLCGACYQACPVKIDIPDVLLHLRARVVDRHKAGLTGRLGAENVAMQSMVALFEHPRLLERAYRLARLGQGPLVSDGAIAYVPGMTAWTRTRDLPAIPSQSFREWWRERPANRPQEPRVARSVGADPRVGPRAGELQAQRADLRVDAATPPASSSGPTSQSKGGILERIRRANQAAGATPDSVGAATRQSEWSALPRGFRRQGTLQGDQLLALFEARLAHYGVRPIVAASDDVANVVRQLLTERAKKTLLVPARLLDAWMPPGFDYVADGHMANDALDRVDGVITGCTVAIALTGTVVLTARDGRRAATLVPDYHLCFVRREQIVELVPEALERLRSDMMGPLTFVSGPSATVDIEMTRVAGVHGPRTVDVVIVNG